jgi:hypothetical protein
MIHKPKDLHGLEYIIMGKSWNGFV